MKIVIDIPKSLYANLPKIVNGSIASKRILDCVKNGTPLPKGHKIIDATSLQEHLALVPMEDRTFRETVDIIDWFPSIAEADKAESED